MLGTWPPIIPSLCLLLLQIMNDRCQCLFGICKDTVGKYWPQRYDAQGLRVAFLKCDQIGQFFNVLGNKFSYKNSPNIYLLFRNNCFGQLLWTILFQNLVTLHIIRYAIKPTMNKRKYLGSKILSGLASVRPDMAFLKVLVDNFFSQNEQYILNFNLLANLEIKFSAMNA